MKSLLPTLLPLLGTLVLAVSGTMQHVIANFVGSHPVWSGVFATAALIVNHWLPAPQQAAAQQ